MKKFIYFLMKKFKKNLNFFLSLLNRCGKLITTQAGNPIWTCAWNPVVFDADLCEHWQDQFLRQQDQTRSHLWILVIQRFRKFQK